MSSLEIAELTGKRPADVMRDIRKRLEKLDEGTERTFASSFKDPTGRSLPCSAYWLQRDAASQGHQPMVRAGR